MTFKSTQQNNKQAAQVEVNGFRSQTAFDKNAYTRKLNRFVASWANVNTGTLITSGILRI